MVLVMLRRCSYKPVMDKSRIALIAVAVLVLVGLGLFFRFDTVPAGSSGGMYRVDRITGETTFIHGKTATQTSPPQKFKPYDGPVLPLTR